MGRLRQLAGRRRLIAASLVLLAAGTVGVIAVAGAGESGDAPDAPRSSATEEWIKSGQQGADGSDAPEQKPRKVEVYGVGADEPEGSKKAKPEDDSATSAQSQSDTEIRAELKQFRRHLAALAKANAAVVSRLRTNYSGPIREGTGQLAWPVGGPVTSPFGPRWGRLHAGIDIGVPSGTPIQAADDGTVVLRGPQGGYGNYTCVGHGDGMSTCYAHQSRFAAEFGDDVRKGDVIGYVGCTGHCFGDHLHFEVRIDGAPTDPMALL